MRVARVIVAIALLLGVALPELARYRSERELRRLITAAMVAASGRLPAPTAAALMRGSSEKLEELAGAMPGDPRPRMYAASAAMLARAPYRAIELYLGALDCGERGEIDVNLGLAFSALEDSRAEPMFVRAVWVSPRLLASVPETYRERVRHTIARLAGEGERVVPPDLPVLPSR
jgi:HAMP domain-containing protein